MFIGQQKILNKIESLTVEKCPNSNLIVGPYGSGKHTICKLISEKLNLEITDITKNLNLDYIMDMYLSSTPHLYLINGIDLTEKQNNTILKLLEEPPQNAFIFILITSENSVLDTILNRCYIWKLKPYSEDILKQFTESDVILKVATTPGQIIELINSDINLLIDYANKIIDKIHVASYANILNISDKIWFTEPEPNKFSCIQVSNVLLFLLRERVLTDANEKYLKLYALTSNLVTQLHNSNFNKQYLFEHYLYDLKVV